MAILKVNDVTKKFGSVTALVASAWRCGRVKSTALLGQMVQARPDDSDSLGDHQSQQRFSSDLRDGRGDAVEIHKRIAYVPGESASGPTSPAAK